MLSASVGPHSRGAVVASGHPAAAGVMAVLCWGLRVRHPPWGLGDPPAPLPCAGCAAPAPCCRALTALASRHARPSESSRHGEGGGGSGICPSLITICFKVLLLFFTVHSIALGAVPLGQPLISSSS